MKSRRVDIRMNEEVFNIVSNYLDNKTITKFIMESIYLNLIRNYEIEERDKIILDFLLNV